MKINTKISQQPNEIWILDSGMQTLWRRYTSVFVITLFMSFFFFGFSPYLMSQIWWHAILSQSIQCCRWRWRQMDTNFQRSQTKDAAFDWNLRFWMQRDVCAMYQQLDVMSHYAETLYSRLEYGACTEMVNTHLESLKLMYANVIA